MQDRHFTVIFVVSSGIHRNKLSLSFELIGDIRKTENTTLTPSEHHFRHSGCLVYEFISCHLSFSS